jgi:cupin 2 domain-containing protein
MASDSRKSNMLAGLPVSGKEELVQTLASSSHVRIERIVSTGQSSPEGFWYDQPEQEWVVVLQGEAELAFDDSDEVVHLRAGDYLLIPAHKKHRVQWTSITEPTVWLAVFFS